MSFAPIGGAVGKKKSKASRSLAPSIESFMAANPSNFRDRLFKRLDKTHVALGPSRTQKASLFHKKKNFFLFKNCRT